MQGEDNKNTVLCHLNCRLLACVLILIVSLLMNLDELFLRGIATI